MSNRNRDPQYVPSSRSSGGSSRRGGFPARGPASRSTSPGGGGGSAMGWKEAAILVLNDTQRPMNLTTLMENIVSRGLVQADAYKDPKKALHSVILRDLARGSSHGAVFAKLDHDCLADLLDECQFFPDDPSPLIDRPSTPQPIKIFLRHANFLQTLPSSDTLFFLRTRLDEIAQSDLSCFIDLFRFFNSEMGIPVPSSSSGGDSAIGGSGGGGGGSSDNDPQQAGDDLGDVAWPEIGGKSNMSWRQATSLILSEQNRPMTAEEICEIALARGLVQSSARVPSESLRRALNKHSFLEFHSPITRIEQDGQVLYKISSIVVEKEKSEKNSTEPAGIEPEPLVEIVERAPSPEPLGQRPKRNATGKRAYSNEMIITEYFSESEEEPEGEESFDLLEADQIGDEEEEDTEHVLSDDARNELNESNAAGGGRRSRHQQQMQQAQQPQHQHRHFTRNKRGGGGAEGLVLGRAFRSAIGASGIGVATNLRPPTVSSTNRHQPPISTENSNSNANGNFNGNNRPNKGCRLDHDQTTDEDVALLLFGFTQKETKKEENGPDGQEQSQSECELGTDENFGHNSQESSRPPSRGGGADPFSRTPVKKERFEHQLDEDDDFHFLGEDPTGIEPPTFARRQSVHYQPRHTRGDSAVVVEDGKCKYGGNSSPAAAARTKRHPSSSSAPQRKMTLRSGTKIGGSGRNSAASAAAIGVERSGDFLRSEQIPPAPPASAPTPPNLSAAFGGQFNFNFAAAAAANHHRQYGGQNQHQQRGGFFGLTLGGHATPTSPPGPPPGFAPQRVGGDPLNRINLVAPPADPFNQMQRSASGDTTFQIGIPSPIKLNPPSAPPLPRARDLFPSSPAGPHRWGAPPTSPPLSQPQPRGSSLGGLSGQQHHPEIPVVLAPLQFPSSTATNSAPGILPSLMDAFAKPPPVTSPKPPLAMPIPHRPQPNFPPAQPGPHQQLSAYTPPKLASISSILGYSQPPDPKRPRLS